jgi:hypothetical protein
VVERPVALQGVVLEGVLNRVKTAGARDRHGAIDAAGIDHEDLAVESTEAGQSEGQKGLFPAL